MALAQLRGDEDSGAECESMMLTCYVEGRGHEWEGVCLDFDVAVHGTSFHEVQHKLDSAIKAYLEYLDTVPKADRERLMNRHVPLKTTLGFMFRVFVTWLFRSRDRDGKHWNAYTVPCGAA